MKYNILICEDDEYALNINKSYIEDATRSLSIAASITTYTSPEAFFNDDSSTHYDVAFLDIRFLKSKFSGVDIAKKLNEMNSDIVIAFLTGEMIDVTDAFKVRAFDYIKKPIMYAEFVNTFNRVIKQVNSLKQYNKQSHIYLTANYLKQKIKISDIVYTEKVNQMIEITLKNSRKLKVNYSTQELFDKLDHTFARPNQTNIVNLGYISHIDRKDVILKNKVKLKISRHYSKTFMQEYRSFNI